MANLGASEQECCRCGRQNGRYFTRHEFDSGSCHEHFFSRENRWQSGNETNEFSISNSSTAATIGYSNYSSGLSNAVYLNDRKNKALDSLAAQQYANLFHKTIGDLNVTTSESIEVFKVAMSNLVPLTTTFSATNLSNDLKR